MVTQELSFSAAGTESLGHSSIEVQAVVGRPCPSREVPELGRQSPPGAE